MFEIDGSQKSGSGTILRLAVALAAIKGEALHIVNIRQNRPQPGLKPQHLESVLTASKLCDADLEGASLNSRELWFKPKAIKGGKVEAEIGTAGSIPMLFMAALPICVFAKEKVQLHVLKGGTDTTHAPTINYLNFVLLPELKRIGVEAEITIQRYGYYPKGMGEATLTVNPSDEIKSIQMETFGKTQKIQGVSVCTFLSDRKVAERQANAATEILAKNGYKSEIKIVNDKSNSIQKGSSIALWAQTDTGVLIGADAIGEIRKTAEAVGKEAAEKLVAELKSKPTVDTNLADMLIPYVALSKGDSRYLTQCISDHIEANIWLAERMLNAHFSISPVGNLFKIEKLAQQ